MSFDLNAGGLWCHSCGAEYRFGFTTCADCGDPLQLREPPAPEPEPAPEVPQRHDAIEYDLADWTPEQRSVLRLMLRGEGIEGAWIGDTLVVPGEVESATDALIDEVDETTAPDGRRRHPRRTR